MLLNTTAPGATTPSFAAQQTFATGSEPLSVAVADLTGDGRPDLIVANYSSNTVSVLLNTTAPGATTPSFAAQQTFATGNKPESVAAADVNGDGRPDLIVANGAASTVSVLLNTTAPGASTPSFAAQQTFATGSDPASVAVADLTGDGRPDLIVANEVSNTVSVLLNTTAINSLPATATSVSSSQNPSTYGQSVTFTATVTGSGTPTGTVTFYAGAVNPADQIGIGTLSVVDGQEEATFSTSTLTVSGSPYAITAVYGGDANNQGSTSNAISQTVNKAHLTVTADNKRTTRGHPNPPLTYTITGFVNGDTPSVVSGAPVLTTSAATSSLPGSYPITVAAGTLSAANYDFPSLVNGTLTVTGSRVASVAIVPSVASPTYGQALTFTVKVSPASRGEPTPGGTVQFQVDGANFGPAVTLVKGAATNIATRTLGAGIHIVTAVYSGDNTYAANSRNRLVTLAKAHLRVTADTESKVYGAAVPTLAYAITGFVNGDNQTVVRGAPKLTTRATKTSRVGTYSITIAVGTLWAANYDFPKRNLVKGKLTVTKAHLTVTAVNKTK